MVFQKIGNREGNDLVQRKNLVPDRTRNRQTKADGGIVDFRP